VISKHSLSSTSREPSRSERVLGKKEE